MKLTEDYLKRFPSGLRKCLEQHPEEKRKFHDGTITDQYNTRKVYRGIRSERGISADDFLGNIETSERLHLKKAKSYEDTAESHAVSVNEDLKQMKKALHFPGSKHFNAIAVGEMNALYGPADGIDTTVHHNWYLYDGVEGTVAEQFSITEGGT